MGVDHIVCSGAPRLLNSKTKLRAFWSLDQCLKSAKSSFSTGAGGAEAMVRVDVHSQIS